MVLSARNYSTQVRAFEAEGKSTLHFFDDLGCAVIWLDKQTWRGPPAPRSGLSTA
jgi:copper chaperone NosL